MDQPVNAILTRNPCGQTHYACASFGFMFGEVYTFEAGETLTHRYRLLNANWGLGRDRGLRGERGLAGMVELEEYASTMRWSR